MKIQQLYTQCLAEATYYIVSGNEAAIIDPLRETEPYLKKLKEDEASLKYIFLTHFHADFVSGHVDLAKETGATIVYGPTAQAEFDFYQGKDNEDFIIGDITLRLLHTPGHTLESSCFLLLDEEGKEYCLFSGDTIFIGDVGRPDLAVTSSISKEDLAAKLYTSLHTKITQLPDEIIVYPNHGKGSACGKNMSSETYDTLGNQKKVNYALDPNLSQDEFVEKVLEGLSTPPQYFPKNAMMNKQVNKDVNEVITKGLSPLEADEVVYQVAKKDALILDVRSVEEYIEKHIPKSIFIGLQGAFAPWVGALIKDIQQPIILVAPKGKEKEAITRLSRIGYDHVIGYVREGALGWEEAGYATEEVPNVLASSEALKTAPFFLDVRRAGEFEDNHIKEAIHAPLSEIFERAAELKKKQTYYVYCAGGYRSLIALSILKRLGFTSVINIQGGFTEIAKNNLPLKKCPNSCPQCECHKQ